MLVITRNIGESFTLTMPDGRVAEIRLLTFKGSQIRVGIDAPRDVVIMRDDAVKREPRRVP